MLNNKYRVHRMVKDFKKNSGGITDILTKYATTPKNHMQVLEDREFSLIFEYLTQRNRVDSTESIYTEVRREPKTAPAPKGELAKAMPQAQKPAASTGRPAPQQPQSKSQPAQQLANRPAIRVPEKKVVDTREGGQVNPEKHDGRLENLTAGRTKQMQADKQEFQDRSQRKDGFQGSKHRQEEQEGTRRFQLRIAKETPLTAKTPDAISVSELASRMEKTSAGVAKTLMKSGVMASLSDAIDFDTAAVIAEELGCKVKKEVIVTIEERLVNTAKGKGEDLEPRAPVVATMSHVNHGKTSLLDYIRNAHATADEAGSIIRYISAYQVNMQGKTIIFLDTPDHEAFTAMRVRGATITDVAILVMAADDGIVPQTIKPINHAKAVSTPIIVAINKMDKSGADPERIKEQFTKYELVPEEWGDETIICPISARIGEGIDNLLEMVNLIAEIQELRANPNRSAHGMVIEVRLGKDHGPVAILLVQSGTLKQSDMTIAGTAVGRVRTMTSAKSKESIEAGSSTFVETIGMGKASGVGDDFHAVADERMIRELMGQRKYERKMVAFAPVGKANLEDLFGQIKQGEMKDLNITVKADVQGSIEAVKASLERLSNEEVWVRAIHCAVGVISESDIMLATTSNAITVGLNVRPGNNAKEPATRNNVDMRMYRIIYDCIDGTEIVMKGVPTPEFKEVELDQAEARNVFRIIGVGTVIGCYVTNGRTQRGAQMCLLRDSIVIYGSTIASLQHSKDSVKEVAQGYEYGIIFEKFQDIKEGDVIEAYLMEQAGV